MILFTKEFFLQLKSLISLHVNAHINEYPPSGDAKTSTRMEQWQVYIHGIIDAKTSSHSDTFQTYVTVDSKEEAYRLYKELAKQVVDSGAVPELNSKLIDEVLTKEEQS